MVCFEGEFGGLVFFKVGMIGRVGVIRFEGFLIWVAIEFLFREIKFYLWNFSRRF